ncbi:MAG: DUF1499 domain-containing protein [Pseudomonadales bacterium]|jgi:uncharacterized protein YaaQ
MAEATRSWWARATLVGSVVALVLLLLGPIGTRLGIWDFQIGLLLLIPAGVLLAAIGLLVALVGVFVSRKRGFSGDPPLLFTSIIVCGAILVTMGIQFQKGTSVPMIHNISTDISDPPRFNAVVALRGPNANPLEYDAETIGPQQQSAYPGVKTLVVSSPPGDTLARVVEALEEMGLDIVAVDEPGGIVEATDTTFWFGFKDDMVVRVRPVEGGSEVDVRSVSRVGQSDLGKNAARIMDLLNRLG